MRENIPLITLSASSSHSQLYDKFINSFEVSAADLLLIRDLCDYAGSDDEALHLLLLLLCYSVNAGSLCINLKDKRIQNIITAFGASDQNIREGLRGRWKEIAGHAPELNKPLVIDGDLLYFQKYYQAEKELSRDFGNILSIDIEPANCGPVLEEVLNTLPFKLHPLQVQGIICALLKNFSIISGGPGTGKTSIVVALLRCLIRLGGDNAISKIKMAAPTGRAAQRMTESVHEAVKNLDRPAEEDLKLLKLEASTIHRLLHINPVNRNKSESRLNLDVLIVDEVSMVDALLMSRLIHSLPSSCRVIFLGDKHQLPSVDAGSVLTDLIPLHEGTFTYDFKEQLMSLVPEGWRSLGSMMKVSDEKKKLTNRITHLAHSYRSEASILKFSQAVNDFDEKTLQKMIDDKSLLLKSGKESAVSADETLFSLLDSQAGSENWNWPRMTESAGAVTAAGGGIHFNWDYRADSSFLVSWLNNVFNKRYLQYESYLDLLKKARSLNFKELNAPVEKTLLSELFQSASSNRILCLTRQGSSGVETVNRLTCDWLREKSDPHSEGLLFHGCQVLVTRNDYSRRLFNGDVGIILKHEGTYSAVFESHGEFTSFPADSIHGRDFAFAITVHKSQGSEYDRLLLLLPESLDNKLLSREILYTGITRAKYLAVICGRKEVFMQAAKQKIERVSGLDLWDK